MNAFIIYPLYVGYSSFQYEIEVLQYLPFKSRTSSSRPHHVRLKYHMALLGWSNTISNNPEKSISYI